MVSVNIYVWQDELENIVVYLKNPLKFQFHTSTEYTRQCIQIIDMFFFFKKKYVQYDYFYKKVTHHKIYNTKYLP